MNRHLICSNTRLISILEKLFVSIDRSNNCCAVDVKMSRSNLDDKSSMKMQ